MKRIRIAVCLIFLASCGIFGAYMFQTRMVEDHTPPVITCREDTISVSVEAQDEEILSGVTASDDKDGDITDSVRISSMSHFIEKGKRYVTYIVFDHANQAGTAQRTLLYTDYHSPRIHLNQPLRYSVSQVSNGGPGIELTAEDCLDGDLTNQIRTTVGGSYSDLQTGSYSLTLQVSNSAGDVCSVPVEMIVFDSTDREEGKKLYPMLEEYILYTQAGRELDLKAGLTGFMRGGQEYSLEEAEEYLGVTSGDIVVQSSVNYDQPGVYTVEYSCTTGGMVNEDGTVQEDAVTAVTKLYIVVEE